MTSPLCVEKGPSGQAATLYEGAVPVVKVPVVKESCPGGPPCGGAVPVIKQSALCGGVLPVVKRSAVLCGCRAGARAR